MASVPSSSSQNGGPSTSSSTGASYPDPDIIAALTMRKAVSSILDNVGFTHAQEIPLHVLTDVAIRFMEKLCKEVKTHGEYCGRSQPAMDDLTMSFKSLNFDPIDFHSYLSQVSAIAPVPPLPLFPVDVPQKRSRINGYKASREERRNRPEHIPSYLPGIRPSGEEEQEEHVPIASTSTASDHLDSPCASFEKSKTDYLSRFEGDMPGFLGAAAPVYGMKKSDKDKAPPVLIVMKGRRTEEERRRIEEEQRRERETNEKRGNEETNGIHHKFKKAKEKDKEKSSRPPSTVKGLGKPPKEKTPHKIKKEDKSRTNTPSIFKETAPLLQPETNLSFSLTAQRMERESPRPHSSFNVFDDPAEEADIPLPRTPGNHLDDSPDEPLFFDGDPYGRNSYNAPSTSNSTPMKSTPTIKDEEKKRKEKEEKRARKEEKKARKLEEERLKEEAREAVRIAARADANLRERQSKEQERDRLERERQRAEERRKEDEKKRTEAHMAEMIAKKKEQVREQLLLKAALASKAMTEDLERKEREKKAKEAKEKKRREEKRKEEKERAKLLAANFIPIIKASPVPPISRSNTPRVDTPKPRELEAIRVEEDKEDSSTMPCVLPEDAAPSNGPTSFPLNMTMDVPAPKEEMRTVTPIKIKKHGETEKDGEKKEKKKHKKDKKERDEDNKDHSSSIRDEERRREKKAKKREKREKEERERLEKEKRVDQSPIQDKIDPNKSGLKLTIKLGGVVSTPVAPPLLSSTPEPSTSLLKLKIKTPVDPKMEVATSQQVVPMSVSTPVVAPPKPRPVTKAELKATPASMPSLFIEQTWKHKHKKHRHNAKASGSDSTSSSDEEERREREKRRERKREKEREKEKERMERERREEERREREKKEEERKEREREKERQERREREKELLRLERSVKEQEEQRRLEKEKREREKEREREREREREKEKEKQKKKQTAFDLALQASTEKKKRKKEETAVEVIWICPVCSVAYVDGAEMIGCDCCDSWFHWNCVGITQAPADDVPWFCERCTPKNGEAPNYGPNKKKCTHWSGQYMDWNIKKIKKSRDYVV